MDQKSIVESGNNMIYVNDQYAENTVILHFLVFLLYVYFELLD